MGDLLGELLREVRLSGAISFTLSPYEGCITDTREVQSAFGLEYGAGVPFHVIADGNCWIKVDGELTELEAGDVVALPFADPHKVGFGNGDSPFDLFGSLPAQPWSRPPDIIPDNDRICAKIVCGFYACSALGFEPMMEMFPRLMILRSRDDPTGWVGAVSSQVLKACEEGATSSPATERLIESIFIQMLSKQIAFDDPSARGWRGALRDDRIARCLVAMHKAKENEISLEELSSIAGLSASSLSELFAKHLGLSPIKYQRSWKLHLARQELLANDGAIAEIAYSAGYSSEAAFNRAFKRRYGLPPGELRRTSPSGD